MRFEMWSPLTRRVAAMLGICAVVVSSGCQRKAPAVQAPPPPTVSVVHPLHREVVDWDVYTGRLASPEVVEVRARVSGFIERVPFNEGAIVKPGDLLYVIDARPYQAELNRAQAELARAEAQQRFAQSDLDRIERLYGEQAAADMELIQARATADQANAAVAAAQAAVESARLNVEWCEVTAPIAGRVGRRLVTVGNLISGGQGEATLLTTITSLDPIHCYVDVDERSVRRYQRMVREGVRPSARETRLPVELALVDETEFTHHGHIDFVDNRLDPETGTIRVRGVFPNPNHQMLPGFFARLRIPGRGAYQATLVPEEAIGTNLAEQYVLTLDEKNTVVMRPVKPGKVYFGLREVQGVGPDDRVIVKGLVQARPGTVVRAQIVPLEVAQSRPAGPLARGLPQVDTPSAPVGLGQGPSRSSNGPAAAPGVGGTGDGGAPGAAPAASGGTGAGGR